MSVIYYSVEEVMLKGDSETKNGHAKEIPSSKPARKHLNGHVLGKQPPALYVRSSGGFGHLSDRILKYYYRV